MSEQSRLPPSPNPFNAGFGVNPPFFAGRSGLLHRLLANLQDGPGRATYLAVVVGGRGIGKTTLLNQIRAHITDEFGWVAIRWTAGPQAVLAQTIDDAYDDALKALRARRGRGSARARRERRGGTSRRQAADRGAPPGHRDRAAATAR